MIYIAVDFDGTLCEHMYPLIGDPNKEVISIVKQLHKKGCKIILYTCRYGSYLRDALEWCKDMGVPIDAANENPWCKLGDGKLYADMYIDDKGINSRNIKELKKVVGKMDDDNLYLYKKKAKAK